MNSAEPTETVLKRGEQTRTHDGRTSVLRFPAVHKRTGESRPTIWRKERDGVFPRRVQLGKNSVGWLESEIDEYIAAKAASRTSPPERPQ